MMNQKGGVRRSGPRLRGALLAAALVCLTSAHAGLFDDDEARKRIAQLSERVDAQNRDNDTRFNKLDDAIKNIGVIQLLNQIEQLNAEIAKLRGNNEVLLNQLEQLQKRQKDFYLDIDARLRKLEEAPPPAPVVAAAPAPIAPPPISEAQRDKETKAYEVGMTAFGRGRFKEAVTAFQSFIVENAQSALVSNALYWIGISQFNLKEFAKARATYEQLITQYPMSGKAPDAMLGIASVMAELGDNAAAKTAYEELLARHPTSDAAAKARSRLASTKR